MQVLLTGNPNVGKSAVFSRLTGLATISANYPGTTVTVKNGTAQLAGRSYSLTDVPGTYSLEPSCEAENAACRLIKSDDVSLFIHVLDATALERNLFFTLEILELARPTILLLNKFDIAKRQGIDIDCAKLSAALGVAVVPFIAVTGEGVGKLAREAGKIIAGHPAPGPRPAMMSDTQKWQFIGALSRRVQVIRHKHASFAEKLQALSMRPATGLPLAAAVLLLALAGVHYLGEALIAFALDPVYENFYLPLITFALSPLQDGVIKTLLSGGPDPAAANFGLLAGAVHIAAVEVFAYVLSFYCLLGLLEDTGYLARIAVLLDNALHKVGLHGHASIPIIMGMGCKVPGILAARTLATRRERIIALSMTLLLAPCISQTAMIIGVIGPQGEGYVLAVFAALAAAGLAAGAVLHRLSRGDSPELLLEIPPFRLPLYGPFMLKLRLRLAEYIVEAMPMIMAGVLIINIAEMAGLVHLAEELFRWPVVRLLGLPPETVSVIALGFLRKDISIALLAPFGMTGEQLAVAAVFLSMYMPCAATLLVMLREAGLKDCARVTAFNLLAALVTAGLLNLLFHLI
ncbi:MAG: ferrous iron transporter B [Elusimicrobiaceae bacterium]|nr:ferrous iron transporter B [Elusimicrobiaceae bacterium]